MANSGTCIIQKNATRVLDNLWSPQELYALDTTVDPLAPILSSAAIENRQLFAFRTSTLSAPFEVLQALWKPTTSSGGEAAMTKVPSSIAAVSLSMSSTQSDPQVYGWIAEQCKSTGWFRINTTTSLRTFVVDRSPSQLTSLVAALRFSFPHLAIPVDSTPSFSQCNLLCRFIRSHWTIFASYLPLLFFLFEQKERAATSFFTALDALLKQRKSKDSSAYDVLKPQKSGKMFSSWFSSKPKEVQTTMGERLEKIASWREEAPPLLEKQYILSLARLEQMTKVFSFSEALVSSMKDELSSFQECAVALGHFATASEPVTAWYTEVSFQEAKERDAEVVKACGGMQGFALRKGSFTRELLCPLLASMQESSREAVVAAKSLVLYFEDYIERKQVVFDNSPFVIGKVALPAGCEAATRPESLSRVAEVHALNCKAIHRWEESMPGEVADVEKLIKELIRVLCSCWLGITDALHSNVKQSLYNNVLDMSSDSVRNAAPMRLLEESCGFTADESSNFAVDQ